MSHDRRGFTLIELLVVAVLGGLVLAAGLQVLITNQRTYTAQSAVIQGQQSTRMALDLLFGELRQLSPVGGDILMMSQDSLRIRTMRKFSRVCDRSNVMSGTPRVTIMDPGPVDFAVGDSVFIFADRRQKDDTDDIWIRARITQVDPAVACPQSPPTPGFELRFSGQEALFATDSVHLGAPVRSFEHMRLGLTDAYGAVYLGRSVGLPPPGDMTPVAGPLRSRNGLEFVYRDALGAVTNVPANVRQIVVRVRTGSNVVNSLGEPVTDSINAWVYTRN